jgi:hypothetical protein
MAEWTKVDGEWALVENQAVAVAEAPTEARATRLPTDGRRQCGTCGVVKSLELFRFCRGRHGRHCRTCYTAKQLARYHKSQETKLVTSVMGGCAITSADAMRQLAAACLRWSEEDDAEDRRGAADAVIYRARQMLAAVEATA